MSEPLSLIEAQALVKKHGGTAAAARAHGVPASTFRYWLNPEPQIERMRDRRRDPEYAERERAQQRDYYWNLSGYHYNLKLLRSRRSKGLARMKARELRAEGMH